MRNRRRALLAAVLAAFSFQLSAFILSAFPPALPHTIYGMARDEYGNPLRTNATIVLTTSSGLTVTAVVNPEDEPGGKLNGTFRRWHENGKLAEQIELRDDQPHGESLACYPSGFLKARVRLERGEVKARETFADGEVPGPPVLTAAVARKRSTGPALVCLAVAV